MDCTEAKTTCSVVSFRPSPAEKIEAFKEETVQKEMPEDESLPEDNEISLEELENQEKIEESSSELDKPETSNNN